MDDDEFVRGTVFGELWPNALQEYEQVAQAHVANAKMNHFWRWLGQHDPIRKIRIFADDYQIVLFCILPNFGIRHVVAHRERAENHRQATVQNSRADWH